MRHAFDTDVEPHWAVERSALGDEDVLELVAECLGLGLVDEIATLDAPIGDRVGHAVDDLAQRNFTLRSTRCATEIFLRNDVGRVERPSVGELDVALLEGHAAVFPVADARIALFPLDHVVRVNFRLCEVAIDSDGETLRSDGHCIAFRSR